MSFVIAAGGVALLVFILSWLRPGRFGRTVLALGAGYLVATFWADTLADASREMGGDVASFSWRSLVHAALVLLPGLIVLLFAPKQQGVMPRFIASLAVAILAVALLLPAFPLGVIVEPQSRSLFQIATDWREVAITIILALGLVDVLFSRSPKAPKKSKD